MGPSVGNIQNAFAVNCYARWIAKPGLPAGAVPVSRNAVSCNRCRKPAGCNLADPEIIGISDKKIARRVNGYAVWPQKPGICANAVRAPLFSAAGNGRDIKRKRTLCKRHAL